MVLFLHLNNFFLIHLLDTDTIKSIAKGDVLLDMVKALTVMVFGYI